MIDRRSLLRIVAVSWLALVVTGLWLVRNFTPEAVAATDLESLGRTDWVRWIIHKAHIVATVSVLLGTLASVRAEYTARRFRHGGVVGALFVVSVIGAVLGQLIPWEQMALWALTTGTTVSGFTPTFGADVRFMLLGGAEVGGEDIGVLYLLHAVVVPAVALLIGAIGGVVVGRVRVTRASDA